MRDSSGSPEQCRGSAILPGRHREAAGELKKEGKLGQQKRFSPEQIIAMLREADVRLTHGERVAGICRSFGISEQSYYRWRRQYGGLRIDQAQKMKQLERENARLRRMLYTLTADHALLGQNKG
jgi:putative transposase